MTTLASFPLISQQTSITSDGKPSEDYQQDCVAACLCAGCMYLNGIHALDHNQYNPDKFKDAAYGDPYIGATAATRYIPYCTSLGVKLWSISGSNSYLVQQVHTQLAQSHPIAITIPDPWVDTSLPQYKGWSHVLCAFADDTNGFTALDPWSGKPVYKSDATWASLLQFGQIWILEKVENDMPITVDIHTPAIAAYFKEIDADHWQCLHNGVILQGDIRKWYCENGTVPYCGLSSMGLPQTNEIPIEKVGADAGYPFAHFAGHGIVVVFGERQDVIYDPQHMVDNPPGAGAVYPLHLFNNGPGTDPAIWSLQKALADAKQSEIALQAQLTQDAAQIAALQAQQSQSSTPDPRIAHYAGQLATVNGLAQQTVGLAQQIVQESTVQ